MHFISVSQIRLAQIAAAEAAPQPVEPAPPLPAETPGPQPVAPEPERLAEPRARIANALRQRGEGGGVEALDTPASAGDD